MTLLVLNHWAQNDWQKHCQALYDTPSLACFQSPSSYNLSNSNTTYARTAVWPNSEKNLLRYYYSSDDYATVIFLQGN